MWCGRLVKLLVHGVLQTARWLLELVAGVARWGTRRLLRPVVDGALWVVRRVLQPMMRGVLWSAKRLLQLLVGGVLWGPRRLRLLLVRESLGEVEALVVSPLPNVRSAGEMTPGATVVVTSGQDQGHLFELEEQPATIGSGEACAIRLPAAPGVAAEHARISWKDRQHSRLRLHHLARGQTTTVAGKSVSVGFIVLEDGDEVRIGPHVLGISITPARSLDGLAGADQLEKRTTRLVAGGSASARR